MILVFRNFDEELVKANKGPLFLGVLSLFSISELYLRAWRGLTPSVDRKVKVTFRSDWGTLETCEWRHPLWASVVLIPKVGDIFFHEGKIR